jgi:hypothetical protein
MRGDNFYIGFAPETTPGTPVSPTYFPRWLNGTSLEIDMKHQRIKEGDASRRNALIIKNGQKVKIKLVSLLRPIELGALVAAAMGASSDSYTAPTTNTTMSSSSVAGATSISIAANTGLTGTGTAALVIGSGTSSEEVATFTTPPTGSGPYTLTVASSGTLKQAHANSSTVQSVATHVLTDQTVGNYFTFECGFGNLYGGFGTALRVRSCQISSIKFGAKAGEALKFEIEIVGIASTVQGTPATVTLEQHQVFLFTQTAWTIDGATTGDAPNLEDFEIECKNMLDDTIQTEQITLAALLYGDLEVNAKYKLVWTSTSRIFLTYYGGNSGTTDAQALGLGSLNVLFTQADGFHTLAFNILTLAYLKAQPPVPKEDGKHFIQEVEGTSVPVPLSGSGPNNAYLLQTTLTNTKYSSY